MPKAIAFAAHRERPRVATELVPDQRTHHLRIHGEGTRGDKASEVHNELLPQRRTRQAARTSITGRVGDVATEANYDWPGSTGRIHSARHLVCSARTGMVACS